jgi:ABC-type branched-subunit amino acid transport system ATPase component
LGAPDRAPTPCSKTSNAQSYTIAGGITAVLGSSGSGKSVLLKACAGRLGNTNGLEMTEGSLSLFGQQTSSETQSEFIKYCPTSNDHLVGVLTVKEHIMFASKMANDLPNFDHEGETMSAFSFFFGRSLFENERYWRQTCSQKHEQLNFSPVAFRWNRILLTQLALAPARQ